MTWTWQYKASKSKKPCRVISVWSISISYQWADFQTKMSGRSLYFAQIETENSICPRPWTNNIQIRSRSTPFAFLSVYAPEYRHTDKHLRLVMTLIALCQKTDPCIFLFGWDCETGGQMDRHRQKSKSLQRSPGWRYWFYGSSGLAEPLPDNDERRCHLDPDRKLMSAFSITAVME